VAERRPLTHWHSGRRGHIAALLAGLLPALSLAPFDLWPAGVAASALLFWLWQQQTRATILLRGWLFGLGMFGSGISWIYVSIHDHGQAPAPLAAALVVLLAGVLALYPALAGWLYHACRPRGALARVLVFTAAWVLAEWLRGWVLTGFPWLYLGYAHTDTALAGWAPVAGVFGLTALVAFSGAALACLAVGSGPRRALPAALALVLWAMGWALQAIVWVRPAGPPAQVGMMQPDIPQEVKWIPMTFDAIIDSYRELSEPLWGSDIVIWPEAAIPRAYQSATRLIAELDGTARAHGSALVTGVPLVEPATASTEGTWYNSVVVLGNGDGRYRKRRLVPFGEYVPLEHWLRGLIAFFDLPMSHMSVGPDPQPLLRAGPWRLAPYICYEVVYPDLVARDAAAADFIVTLSNDSWFGRSIGPLQHFQMARMRALENGRFLLRGTNNGVTAIIDERGRVMARAHQYTRTTLTGEAQAMRGRTPFSRAGSAPVVAAAVLILAGAGLAAITRRRRTGDSAAQ